MRPEFGFTREGRVFVFVLLGIGVGAVNTGNNLLYLVLGLLLGLLLTSGVLSEIVLRGIRLERGRAPRAFAGAPALFELEVTNEKRRFASLSFEVGDLADDTPRATRAFVQELPAGERTTVVVERIPSRRGRLGFTHLRITTRFPFGLLEKSRVFTVPAEALIFPALLPRESVQAEDAERGLERPTATAGRGAEILGVREHRDGDTSRDVHWRRSAALGRLVARERSRDRDPEVRVRLDRGLAAGPAFEQAVSRAATEAVVAIERGLAVRLVDAGASLATATDRADLDRLLALLALVEPSREAGP